MHLKATEDLVASLTPARRWKWKTAHVGINFRARTHDFLESVGYCRVGICAPDTKMLGIGGNATTPAPICLISGPSMFHPGQSNLLKSPTLEVIHRRRDHWMVAVNNPVEHYITDVAGIRPERKCGPISD